MRFLLDKSNSGMCLVNSSLSAIPDLVCGEKTGENRKGAPRVLLRPLLIP